MSIILVLLSVAVVFTLLAIVLHVMVVVHSFRRSRSWGLLSLLVPFASVVYAFTSLDVKAKLTLAGTLLGSVLAASALWTAAGMLTAEAYFGKNAAADQKALQKAAKEYEDQVKEIDEMENIQIEIPADTSNKETP